MVDLHCHSLFSDGDLEPNELLKKAEMLGLNYFSITDHNNCFAYENIEETLFSGRLIKGVEIVTSFKKHIIEILGYGMDIQEINKWCKDSKRKELNYARNIYETLISIFNQNGIMYTKEIEIEKIIDKEDATGKLKQYIYQDLLKYAGNREIIGEEILDSYANFNKKGLNNPNSILFINEYTRFPTIEEVVDLIHRNGGLCFLAHLYQYNVDKPIEYLKDILKIVKLDGVEVYHSSFSEEQIIEISRFAEENSLYKSGGSDFHGKLKPGIELGLNKRISDKMIEAWVEKI